MKTFVCGDIHGNHKGLVQALERSGFDYEKDTLISLGDIVDGFSESFECVEELLKIKNLIAIRGNHDECFLEWMVKGSHPFSWTQGANNTALSYAKHAEKDVEVKRIWLKPRMGAYSTNLTTADIPQTHIDFFKNQKLYHIDKENRGFVHGGFNHPQGLGYETSETYCWDRELWDWYSMEVDKGGTNFQCFAHSRVFIGHSPVQRNGKDTPYTRGRVTNMDTGGGFIGGKVSIMNIDTDEFWQSDAAETLYPGENPRG